MINYILKMAIKFLIKYKIALDLTIHFSYALSQLELEKEIT